MDTTDDLESRHLQRLQGLERRLREHRHAIVDHGTRRRDLRTWNKIRFKHDQRASALADQKHLVRRMIEDLRFDAAVLILDLRRFLDATDVDAPQPIRR